MLALPAAATFVLPYQSVDLAWNPSTDPTVAGYMLSYGTSATNLDNEIDAGTNTMLEVTGLTPGQTNYFTIAAYNAQGVLGAPSGTITYPASTSATSQQTGGLEVTLNVTNAQWSVDNGAWQTNGAIVSGLAVGSHTITFNSVNGWAAPAAETISVGDDQTNTIAATYISAPTASGLMVTLNVLAAQWAVDGGAWQNSGAIVSGLSAGSHTVTFSVVTGWTAPASETIAVAVDQTNSITANYVAISQTGGLQVTLNVAGAQWSVDGGAAQGSGAVVTGLSAGSHTVTFGTVSGWTTPAGQAVSIVANQTSSISATYVAAPQTGGLTVTLNATGAQWTVDQGAMRASGTTLSGLSAGSHTVSFSAVSGWATPANQTISIVANQTNSISATYVVAQTGSLRVTLNVSGAQWCVDNGIWQQSGGTLSGISVGTHTVAFSAVNGYTTPASQTITIAANRTKSDSATYGVAPSTGNLEVKLNVAGAQWSVDSGAWQNSGATVSGLSAGSHTITFTAVAGWTTPASQTVSIVANQTASATATYVVIPQTGALQVTLNVAGAQWTVDNGVLQNSGAVVSGLSVGSHTINFSTMNGWTTPVSQTVSLVANQTDAVTASYVVSASGGAVQVTLTPTNAQWSVDNGVWQNSGATVTGLSTGSHAISFSAIIGWTRPFNQSVTVVANQTNSIVATYVVIPQTGALQVALNVAGAQWTVDNGVLQNSGAIVSGLSVGSHTINFSTMNGWMTPASQMVSIVANQTNSVAANYVVSASGGAVQVTLTPTNAQWSVDNGVWQNSGATVTGLLTGSHTISFGSIGGWTRPFNQTVSISANQTNSITAAYMAIPETGALQVNLSPAAAQWCVDNGSWQNSGAIVSRLSIGSHTLAFGALEGYAAPAPRTITIVANETNVVPATYVSTIQMGALAVSLNAPGAQWAVDGGYWQDSGHGVPGLAVGSHTVTFSAVSNWFTPSNMVVSIIANQTNLVTATYIPVPKAGSLQVTLNPAVTQWAVDNGSWQNSGAVVSNVLPGMHTVTFSPFKGWIAPTNQTVMIFAGRTNSTSATYVVIPPIVAVVGPSGTILARGDASQSALQRKQAVSSSASPIQRISAVNIQPKCVAKMAGTYNGLFYPAKGVTQETSGMLSGLIVNSNGAYSGKILLHGSSLAMSGSFDANGHSCQFLARSRRLGGPVTVDMTLTWNGNQPGILGTVSGSDAAQWTANLIADPAATSELSSESTILFPPAANAPAGFGSATIINEGGSATVVGELADGKRFSQHVTISAEGSAPFYVYLGANEVAFGWIVNLYSATPGGEVAWIKGTTHMQRNYNEGFTSLIAATGSARSIAAPDRGPIDLAGAVEQSSRDAQAQIAKMSESSLNSTTSGSPNGF